MCLPDRPGRFWEHIPNAPARRNVQRMGPCSLEVATRWAYDQGIQGVFAQKGARFRGKWGLGAPSPPPNSPYTPLALPPPPALPPLSPPLDFQVSTPAPQKRGGGRGRGVGGGGGGAEGPFTVKTSPFFGENAFLFLGQGAEGDGG